VSRESHFQCLPLLFRLAVLFYDQIFDRNKFKKCEHFRILFELLIKFGTLNGIICKVCLTHSIK